MARIIEPSSNIYSGDAYSFTVAPKVNGTLIDSGSTVQACLVDRIDTPAATKITDTIALTYNADDLHWAGTFSEAETLKLLEDTGNKQSKLKYSTCYLEVEAAGRTAHILLKVGRGNL